MKEHRIAFLGSEGVGKSSLLAALRVLGGTCSGRESGIVAFYSRSGDGEAEKYLMDLTLCCAERRPLSSTLSSHPMHLTLVYRMDGQDLKIGLEWMDYRGGDFRQPGETHGQIMASIGASTFLLALFSVEELEKGGLPNAVGAIADTLRRAGENGEKPFLALVVTKADLKPGLFEEGAAERYLTERVKGVTELPARGYFDPEKCRFFALSALERSPDGESVTWRPRGFDALFGWIASTLLSEAEREEKRRRRARFGGFLRLLLPLLILFSIFLALRLTLGRDLERRAENGEIRGRGETLLTALLFPEKRSRFQSMERQRILQDIRGELSRFRTESLSLEGYNLSRTRLKSLAGEGIGLEGVLAELEGIAREKLDRSLLAANTLELFDGIRNAYGDYGLLYHEDYAVKAAEQCLLAERREKLYTQIAGMPAASKRQILAKLREISALADSLPPHRQRLLFRQAGDARAFADMKNRLETFLSTSLHRVRVRGLTDALDQAETLEFRLLVWSGSAGIGDDAARSFKTGRFKDNLHQWNQNLLIPWNPESDLRCEARVDRYALLGQPCMRGNSEYGCLALLKVIASCSREGLRGVENGRPYRINLGYSEWGNGELERLLHDFDRFLGRGGKSYWRENPGENKRQGS